MSDTTIKVGDCRERLREMEPESVHCVVTSPPYWGLRDYGLPPQLWSGDTSCSHVWHFPTSNYCIYCGCWRGSLGLEPTPELYVQHMVEVFREVRRVMRDDGTLFLNLGDSYASQGGYRNYGSHDGGVGRASTGGARPTPAGNLKPKDLVGIPWMVAFALRADGWWLRSDIIWHKTNPMPESVRDRPTKSHEYLFLLTKSKRYYYDQEAVREALAGPLHAPRNKLIANGKTDRGHLEDRTWGNPAGRNRRTVWTLPTQPFKGAHFATFPTALVEPCIKAGTSERGCCPKCGKAWERVTTRVGGDAEANVRPKRTGGMASKTSTLSLSGNGSKEWAERGTRVVTEGWRPGCECRNTQYIPTPPIPCTVLDPFGGSGTVGVVAARLGRDAVLCELNAEYAEMSRKRIKDDAPMFNEVEVS